jgi:hypothetical protein
MPSHDPDVNRRWEDGRAAALDVDRWTCLSPEDQLVEVERLTTQLRGAVSAAAALYLIDARAVARACDEADPSGRLFDAVRDAALGGQ